MDTQGLGSGAIYNRQALSGGTQNIMFRFKRSGREYFFGIHPNILGQNPIELCSAKVQS